MTESDMKPSIESYARKRYGLPDEWACFKLERVGGGKPDGWFATNITGAIPGGLITIGKRKGEKNWRLPRTRQMTVTVTDAEYDDYLHSWEMETGRCYNCGGKGEKWAGFNKDGPIVRQCGRCHGTGEAQK